MDTIKLLIFFIAIALILIGFLLGMLYEHRKQSSLFNGNVLVTSHVEQLLNICTDTDKEFENHQIRRAIQYLSEGFTITEIQKLLKQ